MKNGIIYKITSPTRRIYIGKSVNFKSRLNRYKNLNCKSQTKLYRSLNKYGFNNHTVEIIESCTKEELNEKEKYWIKFYNSNSEDHLNSTDGGDGVSVGNIPWNKGKKGLYIASEECKLQISNSLKGFKRDEESRKNYKESKLGRKNPMFGKEQSLETKTKKSLNHARATRVLNTETGEVYNSIKDAANKNNMSADTLNYYISGKSKTVIKLVKYGGE